MMLVMSKIKNQFVCQQCGAAHPKWLGQCLECNAWNSLVEELVTPKKASQTAAYSGTVSQQVLNLAQVKIEEYQRFSLGLEELNRVVGGGLVPGSVTLIGGDPGIGKSSLLLQVLASLSLTMPVLYVSGEESLEQIALRAQRMELSQTNLNLFAETNVGAITAAIMQIKPQVAVIDSIQTMQVEEISGAPGGVSQVRESAALLTRLAKQTNTAIFLVGHVTKSGEVAGPRVLEHIVDTVIYLEGQADGRYRLLRALKNRFGPVNELGVFAMTDKGMREVKNPSAIFLSRADVRPGSVVANIWEGTRPLLLELQALVDDNHYGQPKRLSLGYDLNRLNLMLAILHKHGGLSFHQQDVFINVVGGVKISETSADLGVAFALISSYKNRVVPQDTLIFGEVGLSGEIRPVNYGPERLQEALKHGFKRAIIPEGNVSKYLPKDMEIIAVKEIQNLLSLI